MKGVEGRREGECVWYRQRQRDRGTETEKRRERERAKEERGGGVAVKKMPRCHE